MVEKLTDIVLFADDTSMVFKIERQKGDFDDVNGVLSLTLNWFTVNNLLLNAGKTKCIKFSLPNVRQVETSLVLDNSTLELVNDTKFLGITIDSKLQWGPHIDKLAGKLSSAAYAVRNIRQSTDVATSRLVYFSYFHSVMSYGILLWGKAADIQTIFILQKRAIRAIYNLKRTDSLRELFKEIDILTVASQFIFENIMYVRKNLTTFSKLSDSCNVNLRNNHRLCAPRFRLAKVSNSFKGQCILYYNKIPLEILKLPFEQFKKHVKATLSKKGYYNVQDYLNDRTVWG